MEERYESKRGGTREIFGVLELFNILSEITRIYGCVKMHTLYTPKVTFTLYSIFKNNLVKAKKNTVAVISHASKFMLKLLQVRLQQYVNQELPDVQANLQEAEQPENCQHSLDHRERKEIPENIYYCLIDYAKVLIV